MDKKKLEEALPHAVAAAETWAAWGLELASRVEEGLGHWEESEKWIREEAQAYPTGAAYEWYFWCRRTGRGNISEASKLAQPYFNAEHLRTYLDGRRRLLTYHLCENNTTDALEDAKASLKLAEEAKVDDDELPYDELHLALIATELKEKEVADVAIKETRRLSEKFREKYPDFSDINIAVCDVLDGKPPAEDAVAKLDEQLDKKTNKNSRCYYEYLFGRAYDLTANPDMADKYLKLCVTNGPFHRYDATLAGKYLADRHKTSRP
jgi:hypothetical protein